MNDRFGKGKGGDRKKASATPGSIIRKGPGGEEYVTNASQEASWVKMRSVTEQGALDEFLSTAELAGTDFTAEKTNNFKVIHSDQRNPYLLSAADERTMARKHQKNRGRLTVPRRPKWDEKTTAYQLDTREKESLLEWRRGLAELQENDDLLMTPFERNLEVWRQLWRVIERSDLIVQIVDARNPLLFRCEDLENYVKEVDPKKRNLLLVNKADMMTDEQRTMWADYFEKTKINYRFFSAYLAREQNEAQLDDVFSESEESAGSPEDSNELALEARKLDFQDKEEEDEEWDSEEELDSDIGQPRQSDQEERIRILTVDELEALFLEHAPTQKVEADGSQPRKTTVGLVGYPNVGKSSTINALTGAKKVSVSATPGKTKHFQTIHLSEQVILCDCPGLVFPNFATTKAELVCSGVLPIDQMREYLGPVGLVTQRIPQSFLEAVYGIKIHTRPIEEGGTGNPTASELLRAYARARGFATTGQGNPDESRACRYVLKDYVNGKLLYCHPPPSDPPIDGSDFNKELYSFSRLPAKRQAFILSHADEATATNLLENGDTIPDDPSLFSIPTSTAAPAGPKTKQLDKKFFGPGAGKGGHMKMPFSHQYTEQGRKQLSGRKAKTMLAIEKDVDPADLKLGGKKHFKGNKKKAKKERTVEPGDPDDF